MEYLTAHFTLEELIASSTALRLGIDNTPTDFIVDKLTVLADALEDVRHLLGDRVIHIDSGYRSPALNAAINGAATSAHCGGYAADFTCPTFGSPLQIVKEISASGIKFDQIIMEGTWVHFSVAPAMRRQVLTASFGPGGTKYSLGIGER